LGIRRLNVKTIKAEKDPNHNRNQMMALPDMIHILRYTQRMLWPEVVSNFNYLVVSTLLMAVCKVKWTGALSV
jgi:hypothetical protein